MRNIIVMCVFCYSFTSATYYSDYFHGKVTRSGEVFDQNKLTCASNVYPIGTKIKVTNIENGKSVIVKVNDTGSFKKISIDLSKKAFKRIADLKVGVIKVKIKKI